MYIILPVYGKTVLPTFKLPPSTELEEQFTSHRAHIQAVTEP